ncbi:catechol 2,3-dioxygenase-like lactoylglutathione lyase family enzyme [Anaerosolibacter carboniphilus]|uniref:Catechol 2,3-dioxygenase-like lactoylglutathione lyase family enzyme n=1 Tax=Anaerosolibacter carboniphilus TaxID=1417629 RepID=A0A841KPD4_9FIRM|nr:VOC family protein [Anaerosolibacter carboniphilus]MBB6215283.1 catechol 2,3-dioxygenase-like lactoylglutathione lyase family enzyme [Anaerosolibacter carboniphilus]
MTYQKKSYVEHTAVRVKDIQWHIRFFREVLGMTIRSVDGAEEAPNQVWTVGGMQLISDPSFEGPEGRMAHLGIMTEDIEAALEEAYSWGVTQMPQGRNWFELPDGLCIELMQARGEAVTEALAINPRD